MTVKAELIAACQARLKQIAPDLNVPDLWGGETPAVYIQDLKKATPSDKARAVRGDQRKLKLAGVAFVQLSHDRGLGADWLDFVTDWDEKPIIVDNNKFSLKWEFNRVTDALLQTTLKTQIIGDLTVWAK